MRRLPVLQTSSDLSMKLCKLYCQSLRRQRYVAPSASEQEVSRARRCGALPAENFQIKWTPRFGAVCLMTRDEHESVSVQLALELTDACRYGTARVRALQ